MVRALVAKILRYVKKETEDQRTTGMLLSTGYLIQNKTIPIAISETA